MPFFRNARARNTHIEATLNHSFAAQVGAEHAKPPLALALGEANGRRSEAHPLFTKLGKAVPFAVDAVARAIA